MLGCLEATLEQSKELDYHQPECHIIPLSPSKGRLKIHPKKSRETRSGSKQTILGLLFPISCFLCLTQKAANPS